MKVYTANKFGIECSMENNALKIENNMPHKKIIQDKFPGDFYSKVRLKSYNLSKL